MNTQPTGDLIDDLLGLEPGSVLAELRAQRPDIRAHAEGAYRALLLPAEPGGLSLHERASLAAATAEDPALAAHYAGLRDALPPDGAARAALLQGYAAMVAREPGRVDQAAIDALRAAGLSPQDVVALTQLVAFTPYQARVLAGLRAMADAGTVPHAGSVTAAPGPYTMAEVDWVPRIPPVDAATATPAQLAALEACPPAVRRSTYFLTLAQDPASLAERGALFNAVMYAPRGLPRVDRELATAAVSMVNGCVYCTSVHARRFAELSKEPPAMQRLLDEGFTTRLEARRRAIVDFAALLTASPDAVSGGDLVALRAAGLSPLELLDLVHAIAMFANANRLMQALGESTPPHA